MSKSHYICTFLLSSLAVWQLLEWTVEAYRPNNYTIIKWINSRNFTWKAGKNPTKVPGKLPIRRRRKFLSRTKWRTLKTPDTFDARSHWRNCSTVIDRIRDQGECASCWAFAATSVLSDRMCIESKGLYRLLLSAEDLITCCSYCSEPEDGGCGGGYQDRAIQFWLRKGIVTGGGVRSLEGCKPYSEASYQGTNVKCQPNCSNNRYARTYTKDRYRGKIVYNVPPFEDAIMSEIYQFGPVTASMFVYEDFHQYRNGVYVHKIGDLQNLHAVKLIGWGVESKTKYWIVANSHGTDFGMKGYIKVLRGENHCGIEDSVVTGSMYRTYDDLFHGDDILRQVGIARINKGNTFFVDKFLIYLYLYLVPNRLITLF